MLEISHSHPDAGLNAMHDLVPEIEAPKTKDSVRRLRSAKIALG